jgi:hypothetical protein
MLNSTTKTCFVFRTVFNSEVGALHHGLWSVVRCPLIGKSVKSFSFDGWKLKVDRWKLPTTNFPSIFKHWKLPHCNPFLLNLCYIWHLHRRVSVNGTLVEDKMCRFKGECAHLIFNKCPTFTQDGASAKFWNLALTHTKRIPCSVLINYLEK